MNELITICITALSTASVGWLGYIIKGTVGNSLKRKEESYRLKREVLKNILTAHRELNLEHYQSSLIKSLSDASIDFLLWTSDDVMNSYIMYINKRSNFTNEISEYEEYFGQMILEFRKEIGYKNKDKKITSKGIIDIYKSGQKEPIK